MCEFPRPIFWLGMCVFQQENLDLFGAGRSTFGLPIALKLEFCLIILVCGAVSQEFKQVGFCPWKLMADFQDRFYSSRCVSFPDRHFGSKCEFSCGKTMVSSSRHSSFSKPPTGLRGILWRLRLLQNSSFGGLGATILETFITFEAYRRATGPFD